MSKARKDEKYYVVNRIANDKWLTKSCSVYTYKNRPWAVARESLEDAIWYAENRSNIIDTEIEAPNGEVYQKVGNAWVVVFD